MKNLKTTRNKGVSRVYIRKVRRFKKQNREFFEEMDKQIAKIPAFCEWLRNRLNDLNDQKTTDGTTKSNT